MTMTAPTAAVPTTASKSKSKRQPRRWRHPFLSIFGALFTLILWVVLTEFHIVGPDKLPTPQGVIDAAIVSAPLIPGDVLATFGRFAAGFLLGTALGIFLGLAMSYSTRVAAFFDPIVEGMRPVPAIAMIPFFLLWFGLAEAGKILLIALGVFAIIVVNTYESVKNVPRIFPLAASTLGASKTQMFRTVLLPGMLPGLIGSLRTAAALAFTLVVAAEFMGATSGMGYRIMEARRLYNPELILLGIFMLGILSALIDQLIRRVTNYLTRWSER